MSFLSFQDNFVSRWKNDLFVDAVSRSEDESISADDKFDALYVGNYAEAIGTTVESGGALYVDGAGLIGGINVQNGGVYAGSGIAENRINWYGAAVCGTYADITLQNVVFIGNTACELNGYSGCGGAVESYGGTLTAIGGTISGNLAAGSTSAGGGICTIFATAGIDAVCIAGNTAFYGGGIQQNGGMLTVGSAIFADNRASYGGAMEIHNGGTASVEGCSFSGNEALQGGAIHSEGGVITIRDSVFATASDTIYNAGGMTLGGTIKTAANITSTQAISVEEKTSLVLDLSGYGGTTSQELLTNFDTMFGVSRKNLSITVNVNRAQSTGVYALATNASLFDCPVMLDIESEKTTMIAEDRKFVYEGKAYQLVRENFSAALKIEDVSSGNIYGGKAIAENAELSLATGLMVDGSGVYAALIGGENISGGTVTKNGASFVDISGNIQATAAAGGVYATNCNVTMNAETSVAVADGNFSNIVCAGSVVNENTVLTVNDASRLTISGGTFANAVAGGNYIQKEGGTVYGGSGTRASNTFVTISGGAFLRDVFGGNISAKNAFSTTTNSYVTGSTDVTIDARENEIFIGGNLIAGSSGKGTVHATNVVFKGAGSNLVFGGNSVVCGDSHDATTTCSCVDKNCRSLVFDHFSGTLGARIAGFDTVTFSGGSVDLAYASRLGEISTWDFRDGAVVNFGDVANNFQSDTLIFGVFAENEWTVMTATDESAFANWDYGYDTVMIAGEKATLRDGCWISAHYRFYRENNTLKIAKLA